MLAHCVCYLNSAINPIIYNHMNSKWRRAPGARASLALVARGASLRGGGAAAGRPAKALAGALLVAVAVALCVGRPLAQVGRDLLFQFGGQPEPCWRENSRRRSEQGSSWLTGIRSNASDFLRPHNNHRRRRADARAATQQACSGPSSASSSAVWIGAARGVRWRAFARSQDKRVQLHAPAHGQGRAGGRAGVDKGPPERANTSWARRGAQNLLARTVRLDQATFGAGLVRAPAWRREGFRPVGAACSNNGAAPLPPDGPHFVCTRTAEARGAE